MNNDNKIARAETTIDAPTTKVWEALTNPQIIRAYMFGAEVTSRWKEGSSIVWKGEWNGKPYEDKGRIVEFTPTSKIKYTHFSPLSGEKDVAENYHNITISLSEKGGATSVILEQDGNATGEAQKHSAQNWQMVLDGLKKVVEEQSSSR